MKREVLDIVAYCKFICNLYTTVHTLRQNKNCNWKTIKIIKIILMTYNQTIDLHWKNILFYEAPL